MRRLALFFGATMLLAWLAAPAAAQLPQHNEEVTLTDADPTGQCSNGRSWTNTATDERFHCYEKTWHSVTGLGPVAPLAPDCGTIDAPAYSFSPPGTGGEMGMFCTSPTGTLVLQNKFDDGGSSPNLEGRARLSLGEEFFSLQTQRTEDWDDQGSMQCFDEGGAVMICRVDVTEDGSGDIMSQRWLNTQVDINFSDFAGTEHTFLPSKVTHTNGTPASASFYNFEVDELSLRSEVGFTGPPGGFETVWEQTSAAITFASRRAVTLNTGHFYLDYSGGDPADSFRMIEASGTGGGRQVDVIVDSETTNQATWKTVTTNGLRKATIDQNAATAEPYVEMISENTGSTEEIHARLGHLSGLRLFTAGGAPRPTCAVGIRHALWTTTGAAGTADAIEVCQKDALEIYEWRPLDPPKAALLVIDEDFMPPRESAGQIGSFGWGEFDGSVEQVAPQSGHPGIVRVLGDGALGSEMTMYLGQSTSLGSIMADDVRRMTYWVLFEQITDIEVRLGTNDDTDTSFASIVDGVWWDFRSATSANFATITKAASTATVNTTTTAVVASTWYRLDMVQTAGGDWEFYLDGTLEFTHTTNLPTAAVTPTWTVVKTTAVDRSVLADWFSLRSVDLGR